MEGLGSAARREAPWWCCVLMFTAHQLRCVTLQLGAHLRAGWTPPLHFGCSPQYDKGISTQTEMKSTYISQQLFKTQTSPTNTWKRKRKARNVTVFLSPALICCLQIGLRRKVQTFPGKMVNTLHSDEEKGTQDKESKEESILAMLGIIGTILNLLVIIFVYIYTTLWLLSTCRLIAAHSDVSMGTALEKSSLADSGLESSLWDGREAPTWHRFRWLRPPETGGLLPSAQVDSSRIRLRLWLRHVHDDTCSRPAKDCTGPSFRWNYLLHRQRTCHMGILSAFPNVSLSVYIFVSDLKGHIQVACFYIVFLCVFGEISPGCVTIY